MTKPKRLRRRLSAGELNAHLVEQLGFLKTSAASFDTGLIGEAKRMAMTIRILVHETKVSKSLLGQLGYSLRFISTAAPFNRQNLMTHHGLLAIQAGAGGACYAPLLGEGPFARDMSFGEWWNEIVFKDWGGDALSRREIILTAANQDGGGHVDPELDSTYDRLVRENSLGWLLNTAGHSESMGDPTKAAIRQIAHEVLLVVKSTPDP